MDTATSIALDLVEEVGWTGAVTHLVGCILGAQTWRQAGQGTRLLFAVLVA